MNYRIFTLLISILLLNTISFAQSGGSSKPQEDPIKIDRPRSTFLTINNKKWVKMEFKVTCRSDTNWIENIDFGLTCAFEYSNKELGKKDLAWFNASPTFYVMEKNKDYLLNFYVPWDIAEFYNFVRNEPAGYSIDLKINGSDYPLNEKNYTSRTSARKMSDVTPLLDALSKADLSRNEGSMLYYDETPYLVKYNDSISQAKLPTSVKKN